MTQLFQSAAEAMAFVGYKSGEDVWINSGSELGSGGAGRFVFRVGSGPGLVTTEGRLVRVTSTLDQYAALSNRIRSDLKSEFDDIDARIEAMELTLSNALANLPAAVSSSLKGGAPLPVSEGSDGVDSSGNPLPRRDALEVGYVKNSDGQVVSDWFQNALYRWTRTWSWDANGGFVRSLYVRGARP